MPGIIGIISQRPAADCERRVAAMVASMMHAPFYDSGTCFVPELGFYAGWTAHREHPGARPVAETASHEVVVACAGECFTEAGAEGADAAATLYEAHGDSFVARLNGLFSGFLVDRRRKRVLLFNDRYGIERIYYCETESAVYFASEAKALLRVLPELRAFDDEGVAQFLTFGCTVGATTLYRGVRLLEGGSLWSFEGGQCRKARYFRPEDWESQPTCTAEAFESEFQETFLRILPRYVRTGSRLGISLTGGLDTRMIMACLPSFGTQPVCYTFSGLEDETLDERLAARVAAACGMEHHVLRIGADFLTGYGAHVDRTVYVTDGCFGAMGAHEIYLNAKARHLAPMRLTGNFGSEVLRGASAFKPAGLSGRLFSPDFGRVIEATGRRLDSRVQNPAAFAAFCQIPWSLYGSLAAARSQVTFRTPYLDNEIVALACRAPAVVRQSSGPALRLVKDNNPLLARIPTDRGLIGEQRGPLHMMRRVMAEATFKLDYLHKEGLPHRLSRLDSVTGFLSKTGVLGLHKYLPYRVWFRRELAGHLKTVLTTSQMSRWPYWNTAFIDSMATDHVSGRRNNIHEINAVLTLEAVDRLILRGLDTTDETRAPVVRSTPMGGSRDLSQTIATLR